jgi:hypothetical protein
MKPTALAEHSESPWQASNSMASPAHLVQPIVGDFGVPAGTVDAAQPICDIEPPPLDWQSLVVGVAFVLACLGVLASLVR